MIVGVDEAGQEREARQIDDLGMGRPRRTPTRARGDDPLTVDDHGRVGHREGARAIDEGCSDQDLHG